MSQLDPGHRCPDDEALAELFDGLLTPAEQEALYGRLRGCEACQETLAALGALVAEPPPPLPAGLGERLVAGVLDRVAKPRPPLRVLALRWVDGVLSAIGDLMPLPAPALATRGSTLDGGLRYEVELGGAPVELIVADGGRCATLTARPLRTPPPRARLVLVRGDEVQASLAFEGEAVVMPALDPGHYRLRLEVPGLDPAELPLRLEA